MLSILTCENAKNSSTLVKMLSILTCENAKCPEELFRAIFLNHGNFSEARVVFPP